jgi:hypothetical protein
MSHTRVPYPVHAVFCGDIKKPEVVVGWARNRVEAMILCDNYGYENGEFRVSPSSGPVILSREITDPKRHWRVCVKATIQNTQGV